MNSKEKIGYKDKFPEGEFPIDDSRKRELANDIGQAIEDRKKYFRGVFLSEHEKNTGENLQVWKSFTSFGALLTTKDNLRKLKEKYPKSVAFFSEDNKVISKEHQNIVCLRGRDYYFFYKELKDNINKASYEKYQNLIGDFQDINRILDEEYADVDTRKMLFQEKVLFLALLDYRKNILLNVYNSAVLLKSNNFEVLAGETKENTKGPLGFNKSKKIWDEKTSGLLDGIDLNNIEVFSNQIQMAVDDYYKILLGVEGKVSIIGSEQVNKVSEKIVRILSILETDIEPVNRKYVKNILRKIFRSERASDNPLLNLLQAYLQKTKDQKDGIEYDYLVSILYGGLELAYVYKTVGKFLGDKKSDNAKIIPMILSQYNVKNFSEAGLLHQYMPLNKTENFESKNVLLIDDNIVTGKTFDATIKMFLNVGAKIRGSVTEIDMYKIADNYLPMSLLNLITPSVAQVLPINLKNREHNPKSASIKYSQMLYRLLKMDK
ncbi:MAG: phosphoribosyltransferase [Patescibacteria group bacterium]